MSEHIVNTDIEKIRLAKKDGIFKKQKTITPILSIDTWANWETHYNTILESKHILKDMSPTKTFAGVTEPSGRITFNMIRTKREFGQLSYIIPELVKDDNIYNLPSLASVLSGAKTEYVILHPEEENEDDIETIETLFTNIKDVDKPVYGICVLYNESSFMIHGIAYIAWKDKQKHKHLAFYDPLSYSRRRIRDDGSIYYEAYDFGKNVLEWIKQEAKYKFTVHDLSDYCIKKNDKEFDCPQYHINAEYCYMFSLHFLYTWASLGKPITPEGFQNSVRKSYIIPMEKLSRAYTFDTLRYRIIMMSFIVTILTKYFLLLTKEQKGLLPEYQNYKKHLEKIRDFWYDHYGLSLVPV